MSETQEEITMPKIEDDKILPDEKNIPNKENINKAIIFTFFKTLVITIGFAFYILAVSLCLSPNFAIKVFDFLGATNASLTCYERLYAQSGQLADLYNLSIKCVEAKNYKKASKYIGNLREADGYFEFCQEVNSATISATDEKYVAYVGDLDSYLVSQNILALYKSGEKEKAKELALDDLNNANVYSFGISTYVECMMSDEDLAGESKSGLLNSLSQQIITYNSESKDVLSWIGDRRALADPNLAEEDNKIDKILRTYTCLKIENLRLRIYENANEETLVGETRNQISALQNLYNSLIL